MIRTRTSISIVMPAFNSARFIEQAISSVIAQTLTDWELLIVDDGSTDDTAALAAQLAIADSRIRLTCQASSGHPAIARNVGLRQARGRFVSFLDSDDWWTPNRLELMCAGMRAHPGWAVAFHDMKLADESGTPLNGSYLTDVAFLEQALPWLTDAGGGWHELGETFFEFMCVRFAAFHTNTVIVDTDMIPLDQCRFDESLAICEDTDLWIRLATDRKVGYFSDQLAFYRQNSGSITRNEARLAQSIIDFHVMNYERVSARLSEVNRAKYRLKIAEAWRHRGYQAYVSAQPATAINAYAQALSLAPRFSDVMAICKALLPRIRRSSVPLGG